MYYRSIYFDLKINYFNSIQIPDIKTYKNKTINIFFGVASYLFKFHQQPISYLLSYRQNP